MAKLKTADRWIRITPAWLGNRAADAPFRVEVRRLTMEELDAFREASAALEEKGEATAEELAEHFAGIVRGPIGGLDINGEAVEDFPALMQYAAQESLLFDGLASELMLAVAGVNALEERAAKNSGRRPGGAGGTSPAAPQ